MEITSVHNPLVKDALKLHQRKYREMFNLFIAEGYHLYEEAKKHDIIKYIFTTDKTIIGNNVHYVNDQILSKLTKTNSPQKILCVCHKLKREEISNKVLILEGIQDPGNLGTLIRSALAFNFTTVILDNTVDLYNDKVIRATQGAMFYLNIIKMNTVDFMKENPKHKAYGTALRGEFLSDILFDEYIALILGNEGFGISKELLSKTYKNITIKTSSVESLNVGVAGSIIMHYINNN